MDEGRMQMKYNKNQMVCCRVMALTIIILLTLLFLNRHLIKDNFCPKTYLDCSERPPSVYELCLPYP